MTIPRSTELHRRDLLTIKRLPEFAQFLTANGWTEHPVKGDFEVLRMKRETEWLLVHQRYQTLAGGEPVHVTVWGISATWAKKFIRENRKSA